jgi:hypothetical protein
VPSRALSITSTPRRLQSGALVTNTTRLAAFLVELGSQLGAQVHTAELPGSSDIVVYSRFEQ